MQVGSAISVVGQSARDQRRTSRSRAVSRYRRGRGRAGGPPANSPMSGAGDAGATRRPASRRRPRPGSRRAGRPAGVLEQEAARAGPQRRVHVLVEVERGQHQHPASARRRRTICRVASMPSMLGHPDVHQHDVRGARAGHATASTPSAASPTTSMSRLARAAPEAGADQLLVVGDQHPDHVVVPVDDP